MALTRTLLESLGISAAVQQTIIDEHMATVNGIKADLEGKLAAAQADANKLAGVQKDLDDLKAADYEGKYNAEKAAHDKLKADIAGKAAKAAKEAAVKQYYTDKKVKADSLNLALRATNFDKIELDDAGKIKDSKALDDLLAGDLKPLIVTDSKKVIDSGAHLGEGGAGAKSFDIKSALREKYNAQ